MAKHHFKGTISYIFKYCAIISLCNIGFITTEECKKLSSCSCDCGGKIIDLKDLRSKNGPKYKDYNSTNPDDQFKYSYNPCEPFAETAPFTFEDHCQSVAACQVIDNSGSFQFYDTGIQDSVKFHTSQYEGDDVIVAKYEAEDSFRKTEVILQCSGGDTTFEAYGEEADKPAVYRFILKSSYCCFEAGLSAGTILIIIAIVMLNVYVIFGVIYNAVRNKASGAALFSHILVVRALPGLVKDGCLFLFSRVRPSSYQAVK